MLSFAACLLAISVTANATDLSRPDQSGGGNDAGLTIAFTGDMLPHLTVSARARTVDGYDFRPMLTRLKPLLSAADLAICHLEAPLSPTSRDLSGYPLFSAPWELAEAMAYAGYDGCSTASNHSYDRGAQGVRDTITILENAGLRQSGMAAEPEEGWAPTYYEVGEVTIAHISATYWLNGLRLPADQPWLVQALDTDQVLAIAAGAKRSGADLVIVSVHCCVEYLTEPTATQREMNRDLIRSPDVDLVVGHHSHVVGPVEMLDGKYVLHGLGNFLTAQRTGSTADGVVALVHVGNSNGDTWQVDDVEVVATWVTPGTYRILPAATANRGAYERTMRAVRLYGVPVGHAVWQGFPGYRLPEV